MSRYCSNCGTKVEEDDARFCGQCGALLKSRGPGADRKTEKTTIHKTDSIKTDRGKKEDKHSSAVWLVVVIAAVALLAVWIFGNGGGNALTGTWTLQSVNGSSEHYKVGKSVTLSGSGKLYDNENIISAFLNDEWTLNTWESSGGMLYFTGILGSSCQARYSLSGNTLTIYADGDKLIFRKR